VQTRYLRGDVVDQLFARQDTTGSGWNSYWTLTDRLGSVGDVIDNSATVKDSLSYDGFGNIRSESNSTYRGRYAWTGRELDGETGLQYNRARYYDATTGRWFSQDPLGFNAGDSNLYRYAQNYPTSVADSSGLEVFLVRTFDLSSDPAPVGEMSFPLGGHFTIAVVTDDGRVITYEGSGTNTTDKYGYPLPWRNNPSAKKIVEDMMTFQNGKKTLKADHDLIYKIDTPYQTWQEEAKALEWSFQWIRQRKYNVVTDNSTTYAQALLTAAKMKLAQFVVGVPHKGKMIFKGCLNLPKGAVGWSSVGKSPYYLDIGSPPADFVPSIDVLFEPGRPDVYETWKKYLSSTDLPAWAETYAGQKSPIPNFTDYKKLDWNHGKEKTPPGMKTWGQLTKPAPIGGGDW
jgi:RHS repeat-associated protein